MLSSELETSVQKLFHEVFARYQLQLSSSQKVAAPNLYKRRTAATVIITANSCSTLIVRLFVVRLFAVRLTVLLSVVRLFVACLFSVCGGNFLVKIFLS